jgi:hypothetical protein
MRSIAIFLGFLIKTYGLACCLVVTLAFFGNLGTIPTMIRCFLPAWCARSLQ